MENAEINAIVKIVGLQYKKKYDTIDDLKTLRYGKLMIMTDQDQDGSHIKGLIINFIHHNWPSLLKLPFLEEFITPIIKARKSGESLSFFSIPEFEEWKNETDNWHTYQIKYYKGLGTSTSNEAKEYFSNMTRHRILFKHRSDDDDSHITMAFSKKMVEARKDWLTSWMTESKRRKELGLGEDYLYAKDTRSVTYKDFINKELVLFSNMDNERSIPSLVDGLKPGSRKVVFTCFKRNDKHEIKVAQLAGSVAEHSAYHHGEMSLMSTIINLAQNFVGSNNINLLQPNGQFGTRLQGGKDAASPRYIFTMLSPLARLIFHPHDDPLLTYLRDDNLKIEPVWYMPIIPMILVNGAEGIGTGWMTKIPNHNPREIIENIHRMIRGEEPVPMKPWYKNFIGEIEKVGETRFCTNGEVGIVSDEKLEITELPVGTWTQIYKEAVLEPMLNGSGDKNPPIITDYKEYNTDTTVKFQIMMPRDKLKKAELEGMHKVFKLQSVLTLTSMCAFDRDGVLKRYDSTTHILKEFFEVRLEYYHKRKTYLEGMLEAEALKLSSQARFILEKCDGDLKIENRKKKEMIAELQKRGYASDPVKAWKFRIDKDSALEDEAPAEDETEDESASSKKPEANNVDYEYLLGMTLWSLTLEKKNELLKKRDEKEAELLVLKKKKPSDLWIADLDTLLVKLDELEQKERDEASGLKRIKGKAAKDKMAKERISKKKQLALATDSLPSPHAIRVVPKYDEILKKAGKADMARENKGKRTVKKKTEKEEGDENEIDTADSQEEKPKSKKKEPQETPKKEKKPKNSTKKKKSFEFSDNSKGSESDSSDRPPPVPATPVRTTSRRAAASAVKKFDQFFDESDFEENEFVVNDLSGDINVPSTSPDNVNALKNEPSDFETDDSVHITDSEDSEDDYIAEKKKLPSKRGRSQDNSDDDFCPAGKKKTARGAAKSAPAKKKTADEVKKVSSKKEPVKKNTAGAKKDNRLGKSKKVVANSDDDSDGLKVLSSGDSYHEQKQTSELKRKAISSSDEDDFVFSSKKTEIDKSKSNDDLFDSLLDSQSKPSVAKPSQPARSQYSFEPSEHSMDYTSDDDYNPETKKGRKPAAKAPPKRRTTKKKKYAEDSDDSDFDF